MKKATILAILLLSATAMCSAQKVDKYYVSRPVDGGILYFILPMELFKSEKNGAMPVDFTRNSNADDITVNYTAMLDKPMKLDSLVISHNGASFPYLTQRIYTEASRKKWEHRYTIYIPYEDFIRIFQPGSEAVLILYGEGEQIEYKSMKQQWKTNCEILQKIIKMSVINN